MSKNSKNTLLDNIIKILIILLLLGVIFILAIFSADKLRQKSDNKEITKNDKVLNSTKTAKDTEDSQKKLYTQEEMQEILQMMIDQMNELDNTTKSEVTKLSINGKDDNSDYNNLISTLKEVDIDEQEVLSKDEENSSKIEANNKNDSVDHYNKVVVDNSIYSDNNLDELTKKIGNIVDDLSKNKSATTTYTQNISKEVDTRVDEMRVIVVKKGDTLSKIALRAYGNVSDFYKIVEANRDLIKNPNHIYVGQKLRVPTL
jgi:LysM repeat protein